MKVKIRQILLRALVPAVCLILLAACAKGYDDAECVRLSEKVATGRTLSQADYASMIEQSQHLLHHLIDATTSAAEGSPDAAQVRAALYSDPDYNTKLDRIFTFSSVLYRAHLNNELSADNSAAYEALDSSSERFARLCSAL